MSVRTTRRELKYFKQYLFLKQNGAEISAKIVDYVPNKYTYGGIPVLEYQLNDFNFRNPIIHSEFDFSHLFYRPGKIVTIYCDKENNEICVIKSKTQLLIILLGMLLIYGGLIFSIFVLCDW